LSGVGWSSSWNPELILLADAQRQLAIVGDGDDDVVEGGFDMYLAYGLNNATPSWLCLFFCAIWLSRENETKINYEYEP
jgi:hypothetical protein